MAGQWKTALDAAASMAMIATAATLVWTFLVRAPVSPEPSPRAYEALPQEPLSVEGMPRLGSEEAGVVIVEFSEFQCPFCRVFWQDTMPSLLEQYVTSGEVSIVFRHLPLERIHPMAFVAAEAAECAGEQGQFWEMHDLLFARQSDLRPERLGPWALELGLDLDAFERCVSLHERAAAVRRDQDAARALGISGTPTLLIGKREAPGSVRILRRVKGAAPFGSLVALINQVTEETGPAVR